MRVFLCLYQKPKFYTSVQLVDISKLDLNSKIKKFSYSFICEKGYSPSFGVYPEFCVNVLRECKQQKLV